MGQTASILGQNKPAPDTLTNLFTVTPGQQVQFSVFVTNQGDEMDEITVSLLKASEAETDATYIAYNTPILAHAVLAFAGLFCNEGDSVKIKSLNGTTSFNATGMIYT